MCAITRTPFPPYLPLKGRHIIPAAPPSLPLVGAGTVAGIGLGERKKKRRIDSMRLVLFAVLRGLAAFDLLLLLAEAIDAQTHGVARLQEHRVRLDAEPNSGRSTGRDDIARQ